MFVIYRILQKLKENHNFAPPTAAQKLQEQVARKDEDEEDGKDDVVEVVNKSDPEIIVDDEVPSKIAVVDAQSEIIATTSIVVIDEEKPLSESAATNIEPDTAVNGHLVKDDNIETETISEEPMPVDTVKEIDPLKDLMLWLHDRSPLTKEELSGLCITMEDFELALKSVQPSAKREGFASVPDVSWNDVGSLAAVREELQMAILVNYFVWCVSFIYLLFQAPIRHIQQFKELGLNTPTGVLLCGPPGCGKTLIAKALANEAGINFISVKGPELLNMVSKYKSALVSPELF